MNLGLESTIQVPQIPVHLPHLHHCDPLSSSQGEFWSGSRAIPVLLDTHLKPFECTSSVPEACITNHLLVVTGNIDHPVVGYPSAIHLYPPGPTPPLYSLAASHQIHTLLGEIGDSNVLPVYHNPPPLHCPPHAATSNTQSYCYLPGWRRLQRLASPIRNSYAPSAEVYGAYPMLARSD